MNNSQPQNTNNSYKTRLNQAEAELSRLEPLSLSMSRLRLVTFTMATVAFFAHVWMKIQGLPIAAVISACSAAVFVALVIRHRGIVRIIERQQKIAALCREGIARIARQWDKLGLIDEPKEYKNSQTAADLNLLGSESLYKLTGGAYTDNGKKTLVQWLLNNANREEIINRQEAVSELSRSFEKLLELRFITYGQNKKPADPSAFIAWTKSEQLLAKNHAVLWTARILAPLPLLLSMGSILGYLNGPFWILAMIVNLAFTGVFAARVHRVFNAVSADKGGIEHYSSLFKFVTSLNLTSDRGKKNSERMTTDGYSAHLQMQKLEKISSFADLRFSAMMYFPIQAFTLIDFFVLRRMEKWQAEAGKHTEEWLEALGEFEALAGLATLAHDNPDYTFPTINEGTPHFSAKALGHPLLPPSVCVSNDVTLEIPGKFLLVTGSNMSGKSSLLRSIGINVALAGAGGPVCAEALSLTPFVLGTSFRAIDSISQGISFFMAELKRLKEIVTLAEESTKQGPTLLFLLDEILQGTNIIERRIAVVRVIRHLLKLGCIGAVSSHDLTLAEADGISKNAQPVYFTESFRNQENGREMYFDYLLRPGLAPTTNALELLKLVGLDIEPS